METAMKGKSDFRIVIDMREPNKAIKRSTFPIPSIEQFRAQLQGAAFFSKLDLKNAFFHLKLHDDSKPLTTFMTSRGPMRYTRLMFGVNAAPEIFQRVMTETLQGIKGVACYIDDILIYAKTKEEHDTVLRAVLARLRKANFTLNQEKCEFSTETAKFLGFHISKEGIRPLEEKLEAIKSFRAPKCKSELQSFLGLVTHVSPFIKDMPDKTEPLRALVRKNAQWEWGENQRKAFESLQESVETDVEAQAFFDPRNRGTRLYTDASPWGLGAILAQPNEEGRERVVAMIAKSLTDTEKRYPQTQREALAVVWAVERLHYFLLGHPFKSAATIKH